MDIDLSARRIRELRNSEFTVADLRQQIGYSPRDLQNSETIKTKKQINSLGKKTQQQINRSTQRRNNSTNVNKNRVKLGNLTD